MGLGENKTGLKTRLAGEFIKGILKYNNLKRISTPCLLV